MNITKTYLYLVINSVILILIGHLLFGHPGFLVMLILAILLNIAILVYNDKEILALSNAKNADGTQFQELNSLIQSLSMNAKIPVPSIYFVNGKVFNLLSGGLSAKSSYIVISMPLIEQNDKQLLKAAICYGISQIKTKAIFPGVVAANMAYFFSSFFSLNAWKINLGFKTKIDSEPSDQFGKLMLAPIAALLIRVIVPKSRVYDIDAEAAVLFGNSRIYIESLEKLEVMSKAEPFPEVNINPSLSHLFAYNPLNNKRLTALFNRFPSFKDRLDKLNHVEGVKV